MFGTKKGNKIKYETNFGVSNDLDIYMLDKPINFYLRLSKTNYNVPFTEPIRQDRLCSLLSFAI